MIDAMKKYQEVLAAFAVPGARDWNVTKGGLTYWGKAAGLTADDIIRDARALGVKNRDGSIRSGWDTAHPRFKDGKPTGRNAVPTTPRPRAPQPHARYVRNMIGDLDAIRNLHSPGACPDALFDVTPCIDWLDMPGWCDEFQTYLFFRALFRPEELVHVMTVKEPPPGRMGENIRPAAEWMDMAMRGGIPGDGIIPQPLTGKQGTTADGKPSFISNNCIAEYPFAVIEFDDMKHAFNGDAKRGLAAQFALWHAFAAYSKLAPSLVSVTHSGGKSLHAILHVGAKTAEEWEAARARLVALFASDPTVVQVEKDGRLVDVYPFRCDLQSLRPRQVTRIPGVRRGDNQKVQGLYYLNPDARPTNMWDWDV